MNRRGLAALLGTGVLATGVAVMLILSRGDAQAPKSPATSPEGRPAQLLTGRVVDGLGIPMRRCLVVLEALSLPGAERVSANRGQTDGRGRFALPAPPMKSLALTLQPEQAAPVLAATGIRLSPDQDLDLGDVPVPARSGVTVRVTRAEDGAALPGTTVRLAPLSEPGGLPPCAAAALRRETRTGEAGRAVLYEVPAGAYRVTAEAPGRAPVEVHIRHATANPAATAMALPLALTLRGRVEGRGGAPVPGVRVRVRPSEGGAERRGRGGPLGGFAIDGLSRGPHRLELVVPESGTWIRDPVHPGEDTPVLRLPEGGRLTGRVLGPERAPLPGALVRASTLDGAPLARDGWLWQPAAVAGEDGSFGISGLPPGRFRLLGSSEGLASKEAGPLDADGTEVTLLLERPGVLSGKVLDHAGLPLQEAVIELLSRRDDGTAFAAFLRSEAGIERRSTRSARGGAFRLAAPDDETFWLRVTAPEQAPLALGPFRVDAGATQDLGVLKLPKPAWIQGRVLDVRDKPAIGAAVHADPLPPCPPGTPAATGTSDPEGRFVLGPLAPGYYEVFYHSPEEETASQRSRSAARTRTQVRVEAGEQHVLEIRSR